MNYNTTADPPSPPVSVTFYGQDSRGWICPRCDRVHSPLVMECHYCNQGKCFVTTTKFPFSDN